MRIYRTCLYSVQCTTVCTYADTCDERKVIEHTKWWARKKNRKWSSMWCTLTAIACSGHKNCLSRECIIAQRSSAAAKRFLIHFFKSVNQITIIIIPIKKQVCWATRAQVMPWKGINATFSLPCELVTRIRGKQLYRQTKWGTRYSRNQCTLHIPRWSRRIYLH